MNLRDLILNQKDEETTQVEIPEWVDQDGKAVILTLKAMDSAAHDKWELDLYKDGKLDMHNLRARMAAASIVDDKGELVFTEKDLLALGKKSSKVLVRLYDVASKLNYANKDDIDKIAKNS